MLVISQADVRELLTMGDAIEATAEALMAVAHKQTTIPERHRIPVPAEGGDMLVMSGRAGEANLLGVKIVSLFPRNPSRGLPSTLGVMVLINNQDGTPEALLDATYLTALRTGATSGLATRLLARPESTTLGIIGAGSISLHQVQGVMAVRPIERVLVFDIARDRAEHLCRLVQELRERGQRPPRVEVAISAEQVCGDSDIICTCTTAQRPVIRADWLSPGTHVNAVGAFTPAMQEIDEGFVCRCAVVAVDAREAATVPGDLAVPLADGSLAPERVVELGAIANHEAPGRTGRDQWTLFKTVGVAAVDITCAYRVLERARARNMGTAVRL